MIFMQFIKYKQQVLLIYFGRTCFVLFILPVLCFLYQASHKADF